MRIVIIEDERLLADDLEKNIRKLIGDSCTIAQVHSVSDGIAYFKVALLPDLIISDIQLGDGLSFEILASLSRPVPVIFCTAWDASALDAFHANGFEYILKPFDKKLLLLALKKYSIPENRILKDHIIKYDKLLQMLTELNKPGKASVNVCCQGKLMSVNIEDIALFFNEDDLTRLVTHSGRFYDLNKSIDELEKTSGSCFFRVNPDFLVKRSAIVNVSRIFFRKLLLVLSCPVKEKIVVSRAKVSLFLEWLSKTK